MPSLAPSFPVLVNTVLWRMPLACFMLLLKMLKKEKKVDPCILLNIPPSKEIHPGVH